MYVGSFGTLAHPVRGFNPLIARNLAGSHHQSRVVENILFFDVFCMTRFNEINE